MAATGLAPGSTEDFPLQVVATAGHVDHGKSALILRLTDIDPDRLAEEKRRGLTIDLGFAWTTLPSGREVGFVDVPGHERFVRNMLAGIGPVRLVLFVVAADEGWKPQSEEHLQIVDVLGARDAVVALTKRDLVDDETLGLAVEEIRDRLAGTSIGDAPVVPCSALTGDGLDHLRRALDDMLARAAEPEQAGRPRQFLDRVFTIKGAGTVVTGTLTGGPIALGQEAQILPSGHRARIRGLQTHKRSIGVARPVSRVAVNLTGTPREELDRGDVLVLPGQWRSTQTIQAAVRPVRGLDHPLTSRGAYKLYAGSAERDVRIRFYTDRRELRPGEEAFARIVMSRPLVLDFKDRFVLREAGRRETVAGGAVLDVDPPVGEEGEVVDRLTRWAEADRSRMAHLVVLKRGAIRAAELALVSGLSRGQVDGLPVTRRGDWLVSTAVDEASHALLRQMLETFHREHPLRPGLDLSDVRAKLVPTVPGLAEALVEEGEQRGDLVREGTSIRLASHRLSTAGREDADRLVDAVRSAEPSPPTVRELAATGFGMELIKAVCAEGRLVRVSPDIVTTPELVARAEAIVREHARPPSGITVSAFRESLGTSRKYALPILEYLDARGVTRRRGDVRIARS